MRFTLVLLLVACAPAQEKPKAKGHLLIVGGGTTTSEIQKKGLELAAGGPVLVIPQASADADSGPKSAEMWRDAGAKDVSVLDLADPKKAVEQVKKAALLWMPGGDQNRLMKALDKTGVPEAIRQRFAEGACVGGTSAGAAVMSKVMITGDADLDAITAGRTETAEGLGLWPEVIVDQHFLKRHRFNRLAGAVLDHPGLVGVGIDESTAVVVSGREFEVIGKSEVVVIDARKAASAASKPGETMGATGIAMAVLKAGMKFELGK